MNELTQILQAATANIAANYYRVEIDGGEPVYRERVYCYELYHQMRKRWPEHSPYQLNGELDKASHPILEALGAAHIKPDLLIHRQGDMAHNHAIIEVKRIAPGIDIKKDLKSLDTFIERVGYQRAIYLFFGSDADESLLTKLRRIVEKFDRLSQVEIWLHNEIGSPARLCRVLSK